MAFTIGAAVIVCGIYLIIAGARDLASAGSGRRPPALRAAPPRTASSQAPGSGGLLDQAAPGMRVRLRQQDGASAEYPIEGIIRYTELWQRRKSPNEPWVPTGSAFTAIWLGDALLYAWKGKLRLLDTFESVTDVEIKQHFQAPARRFGESDETALVNFAYPPGSWQITDIGKFRVDRTTGTGLRLASGATGRFIHASGGTGLEGQTLVVEDYFEGAGGQDTVWRGRMLDWQDLLEILD